MQNRRADHQLHLRALLGAGAAIALLASSACTAMRPIKQPGDYIESVQPKLVRVTCNNGETFKMIGAHVDHDGPNQMIVGFVQPKDSAVGMFREVPLSTVSKVEAEQWASDRTALAITGGILAWIGFTYLVIHHADTGSF